jgi:hypothetical protein
MSSKPTTKNSAPGWGILAIVAGLLAAGCMVTLVAGLQEASWAHGALAGWLGAGVMGLTGWWTTRRAMTGGNNVFLKYVLGGMLIRMMLIGLFAGLVLGLKWFDQVGFVVGLLSGIVVFLGAEIIGLDRAARRMSPEAEDCAGTIEGVTGRG